MRMIITTTLSLFTLYSSRLMAHPYVSEADTITQHEIFHAVGERGLSLFIILVIFILFKAVMYFNETDSSNK